MKELLRRCLRPLATAVVRFRSQPYAVPASGRCVVIAPHQDDEAFGCAGLILTHRAAEQPVDIVYLTDGAASHPDHPRLSHRAISHLRRNEAAQAMQHLRVPASALHFLDAPDGTLAQLDSTTLEELAARLAALLIALQPSQLFLPCRDDSSAEHTGGFQLTMRALQIGQLQPRIFEYPVWARWRPQQFLKLGLSNLSQWRLAFPQHVALKRAALSAYVSQIEPTPPWPDPVLPRGFVRCFASAEEFFFER